MLSAPTSRSDRPLYIHLGLSKTGTTSLQKHVFPTLRSLDVAIKPRADIFSAVGVRDPGLFRLAFRRSPLVWRRRGAEILAAAVAAAHKGSGSAHRPLLISDQGVSAHQCPFALGDHFTELARVAQVAGYTSVRAVVVVRRQDQWIGSKYAQHSDRRRGASQDDFVRFIGEWVDPARGLYTAAGACLDYGALYENLEQVLGHDAVLVLPYETLDADPAAFVGALFRFLEEPGATATALDALQARPQNVRSDGEDSWVLRPAVPERTVRLRPSRIVAALGLPSHLHLRRPDPGRGDRIVMTAPLRTRILDAYERPNRTLAKRTELDLTQYGYYGNHPNAGA
jgi:hypothetical protein